MVNSLDPGVPLPGLESASALMTPSGASYLTSLCLYVLICETEMTQVTHRAVLRVDGDSREMLRRLYLEGDPQIAMETIHCRCAGLAYPG